MPSFAGYLDVNLNPLDPEMMRHTRPSLLAIVNALLSPHTVDAGSEKIGEIQIDAPCSCIDGWWFLDDAGIQTSWHLG